MIATCASCHNTGAVDERYCSCGAAMALRARIDADPQMQELRARIEKNLGAAEARTVFVRVDDRTTVIHPLGPRKALNPVDVELAAEGFHRIGRIDSVGRRSLWLREEQNAIELRAGREGGDAMVRITNEHALYHAIVAVLAAARFAAEYEQPDGLVLEPSFALDRYPASVHRIRSANEATS